MRLDGNRARAAFVLLLVVAVGLVYHTVGGHGFLDLDDNEYVFENPVVARGLTLDGARWAFMATHAANWHPVTWLSHMLDVELFGLDPGAHHLVGAGLHALATVVLFLVLSAATGRAGRSVAVAMIFAIHPLHVESVAWVSERKDVLCALFLFLAVGAHVRFARSRRGSDRALVAACVALALLAKPMAVTAPFLLLLLDAWPLRRVEMVPERESLARFARLAGEKVELFVLAAAASVMTLRAQSAGGAVEESVPLAPRLANAVVTAVAYLRDAVWPAGLSPYYPHPASLGETHSPALVGGALALIGMVTIVAARRARTTPALMVGWLWYLGMLVPTLGLVQVGLQARADRYTYVPLVGLSIAVVWWTADKAATVAPATRRALLLSVTVAIVALGAAAERQVRLWRTPAGLYAHAIALEPRNWFAWNNLSAQQIAARRPVDALRSARTARTLRPRFANAWYNEGVALAELGRGPEAVAAYERALEIDPGDADAWVNVALVHQANGAYEDALRSYREALRLRPAEPHALYWSAALQLRLGDRRAALETWRQLDAVDPDRAAELRRWLR